MSSIKKNESKISRVALIASSDEGATKKLIQALSQAKWEAHCFRTGREFLNALRSGMIPDFIFLDQDLARVDGVSVLKNFLPVPSEDRCPIVFIRDEGKGTTERELAHLGVDDCLKDAFRSSDALESLRRLTWEGGEAEVRNLLEAPLFLESLSPIDSSLDHYRIEKEKDLFLILPKGALPSDLVGASSRELKGKVSLYRNTKAGWRKVWPRSGRPLVGQLVSA